MTALDRTFAFEQVAGVTEGVGNDLDFDVVRAFDEFFDEYAIIAEAVARFVAAGIVAFGGFGVVPGDAQPLATAPGRRLDHDRVADIPGNIDGFFDRFNRVVIAGDGVNPGGLGQTLGFDLVTHRGDGLMLGADEDDAVFFQPP